MGSKRNTNDDKTRPPPSLFSWKETKSRTNPAFPKLPGRNQDTSSSLSKRLNPSAHIQGSLPSKLSHTSVSTQESACTDNFHMHDFEHVKSHSELLDPTSRSRPWMLPECIMENVGESVNPPHVATSSSYSETSFYGEDYSLPPLDTILPSVSPPAPLLPVKDPSDNSSDPLTTINSIGPIDLHPNPNKRLDINDREPPSVSLCSISISEPSTLPSQATPPLQQVPSPEIVEAPEQLTPSMSSLSSLELRSETYSARDTCPPVSPHSSPSEFSSRPSSSRETSPPERVARKRRNNEPGSKSKRPRGEVIMKFKPKKESIEEFHYGQYAQEVIDRTKALAVISKESTPLLLDDQVVDDTEDQDWQETSVRKTSQKQQKKRRTKKKLTDITLPKASGGQKPMPQGIPRLQITGDEEENVSIPFVPYRTWSEEYGYIDDLVHSFDVVRNISDKIKYETHFTKDDESREYDINKYPYVELEFPNSGTLEKFLLTEPKDKDLYNPLFDLEDTVKTIISYYVPEELKNRFFPDFSEDYIEPANDGNIYEFQKTLNQLSTNSLSRSISPSPLSNHSIRDTAVLSDSSKGEPSNAYQRLLRARRDRDGPAFRRELEYVNKCFRWLKDSPSGNMMLESPRNWVNEGIPPRVVERVMEETYQRCVGPRIPEVRKYAAFSSLTYGELLFKFVDDIIQKTGLRSDSLFLDLGSGVGNVVLQAALQTGCRSYGIEVQEVAASVAVEQHIQLQQRCRLWGLRMGEVELENGDITRSARLSQLMGQADVVLINNYIFAEQLNESIKPLFLDLKDGAKVVSLKPFAEPNDALLTDRNVNDHAAIFHVKECSFAEGTVSWTATSGSYYIQTVARDKYARSLELWEQAKAKRAATGGRRSRKIASREQSESAG